MQTYMYSSIKSTLLKPNNKEMPVIKFMYLAS